VLPPVLATAKVLALQSPSERRHYAAFLSRLSNHGRGVAAAAAPGQAASMVYGAAALGLEDAALVDALVDAVAPHLAHGAAALAAAAGVVQQGFGGAPAGAAAAAGGGESGDGGGNAQAAGAGAGGALALARPAGAAPPVLTVSEAASLLWGLGTLGRRPEGPWLEDLAACIYPLIPE
jgi:hypothetical protein